PLDTILVEGDHHVHFVALGIRLLIADAETQPRVSPADQRLVAVVSIHVEPETGCHIRQVVTGLVQPVARRAGQPDRDLLRLVPERPHLPSPPERGSRPLQPVSSLQGRSPVVCSPAVVAPVATTAIRPALPRSSDRLIPALFRGLGRSSSGAGPAVNVA